MALLTSSLWGSNVNRQNVNRWGGVIWCSSPSVLLSLARVWAREKRKEIHSMGCGGLSEAEV